VGPGLRPPQYLPRHHALQRPKYRGAARQPRHRPHLLPGPPPDPGRRQAAAHGYAQRRAKQATHPRPGLLRLHEAEPGERAVYRNARAGLRAGGHLAGAGRGAGAVVRAGRGVFLPQKPAGQVQQ
nr:hypothetical protein [Tanacetum cinerariifolium]